MRLSTYVEPGDRPYGPPGATSNGFNENLTIVRRRQGGDVGRCALSAVRARSWRTQSSLQVVGQSGLCACPDRCDSQRLSLAVVLGLCHPRESQEFRRRKAVRRVGHF